MGFRFRKQIGPKGFKINIGKRGISSASVKIAPGVTLNSKRGATVGIPGTGLSYNTGSGRKRSRRSSASKTENYDRINQFGNNSIFSREYANGWREFTGGYNKKAMLSVGICLLLCLTPLWPLFLVLLMPALIWFLIDTIIKIAKYTKYLRISHNTNGMETGIPLAQTSAYNATSRIRSEAIRTKVAGVTKGKRQEYLDDCYPGQEITVVNKPMAKYPHAMAVYTGNGSNSGKMLGYLNDELAQEIFVKYQLTEDDELGGEILDITGGTNDKPTLGCNIEFYVS